ncbi:LPXTG cell wall anchor domain-containing protein [Lactococcus kimchii]|nr:LPXTG cell wall anchor domain-containing protein [Lactococcus sp. S-13]
MEIQNQQKKLKKMYPTKRKFLYAGMSGALLMTSTLLPTAFSIMSLPITAKAAVLEVDALTNVSSSNSSNTSPLNRWNSQAGTQNVNFTISGNGVTSVTVNPTPRYVVLTVPQELRGYVSPTAASAVTSNITVDLNQVALLTTLVQAGNTFLSGVAGLGNNLTGLDLNPVIQQLNLLQSVQNIGGANLNVPTTMTSDGALISGQLDGEIGRVASANLIDILNNLKNAVNALQLTGLSAPLNPALDTLKGPLNAAIDELLTPLTAGTGEIVNQLAQASVLGDTTASIPTQIDVPTSLQGDVDARFAGSVVQTSLLDVNLFSNANGVSYVYLAAASPTLVAPTENLTATTSAVGAADATATLPTTLTNSEGVNVPVNAVITNTGGTPVTNGQLAAGTYTVTYSATGYDPVTQTLVVTDPADTTRPDAPLVTSITGNSQTGYTIIGTAEPNSTVIVENATESTVGTTTTSSTGDYTVNLPGSVGPDARLLLIAIDASGNRSASTQARTPVDPTLVTPTGILTAMTSATGASDANATLPTTLKNSDGDDVPVTAVITNTSGTPVTNGQLAAGTYSVTYSATGYDSVTQTLVVSDGVDTTAPAAPVVDSVTGNSQTSYTVTGTAEPNSSIMIRDTAGNTVGTTTTSPAGDFTVTLPGSVGPNADLLVTATDVASNASNATPIKTPADVTLIAPTGVLTATTSAVGAADATATLTTTLKNSEGADVPVTAAITNAMGETLTNGQLAAGTYLVTYMAAGYGDVVQLLVVSDGVDTTAPAAPVVDSVTGNSQAGYIVTGTAEPNSSIAIKDTAGNTMGTTTTSPAGDFTVTLPGSVGPNADLLVTATDAASNASDATPITTPANPGDTTAPDAPVITKVTGTSQAGYTITGTAEANSTIKLYDKSNKLLGTAKADGNGAFTINLAKGSIGAKQEFTAIAIDAANNESQPTSAMTPADTTSTGGQNNTPDTTAPNPPTVDHIGGNGDTGYTVGGTGESGATITIRNPATGQVLGTTTVGADGTYTVKLPAEAENATTLSATATDAAGNESTATLFKLPSKATGMSPMSNSYNSGTMAAMKSTKSLPMTGEASTSWLVALGAIFTAMVGSLFFWKNKSKKEEEK